jgi:hypothetical protein
VKFDAKFQEVNRVMNSGFGEFNGQYISPELFTNALKGTASGEAVLVDDVSPLRHTATAKVRGKNLIPPFSDDHSVTREELTQSCKKGGQTITINGVGNTNGGGRNNFRDHSKRFFIEKGKTYTLSQAMVSGVCEGIYSVYISRMTDYGSIISIPNTTTSKTFVAEETAECYIGINVVANDVYDNVVVRYQLEEGAVATEYEPYVNPEAVTVTRCGKNILPYPFYNKTKTENGITFTDNGNGTLTVNGTAEDNAFFHFLIDSSIRVKGNYILSGLSGGSGSTYYIQPFVSGVATRGLTNGSISYKFDGILEKITMVVTKGTTLANLEVRLQLELGDKSTEFVPYTAENRSPNADGIVKFVAISPSMTLLTDTEGAIIEVEYNKDINKGVDDTLLADSTNPVQNKALYDLLTVEKNVTKKTSASSPLSVSGGLPLSALEISIKQTTFPMMPGNNKISETTISNDYMQNASFDLENAGLSGGVPVGQDAIFSFNVIGNVESLNPTMLWAGYYGFEAVSGVDNTIKSVGNGRYYLEIKGHEQPVQLINWGISINDEETYLDNCALRYDGSTEYEDYEAHKTTYDPSTISVVEKTTGQSIKADKNGNVNGFVVLADGSTMDFYLDNYSSYFTLDITYRRSLATEIAELKTALLSTGSNV